MDNVLITIADNSTSIVVQVAQVGYDDSAVLKDADALTAVTDINKLITQDDLGALGGGDMLKSVYDTTNNSIVDNAEKVNGLTVLTAVPATALFTDTVYDDTAIQNEVDLNTAKVSNIAHPLVETAVPLGALFTDTVYSDTDVLKDADTVSPVTGVNKLITQADVTGGGDMSKATYDITNNGIVDDSEKVNGLTVETAVPLGAVFTDTDTIYDDTAIQNEVDLNTAKVGITPTQASDITANNAKVSNIAHPLVETAVPLGAYLLIQILYMMTQRYKQRLLLIQLIDIII